MRSITGVVCGLLVSACSTTVFVGIPIDGGPEMPPDAALSPVDAMPFRPPTLGMPTIGPEFPVDEPINAPDSVREPSMACATTRCLVAWRSGSGRGVIAARVDANGELLDERGIVVVPESLAPIRTGQGPFVVRGGRENDFFVVWAGPAEAPSTTAADPTLYSVHVDEAGVVSAMRPIFNLLHYFDPELPISITAQPESASCTDPVWCLSIVITGEESGSIRTLHFRGARFHSVVPFDIQAPDIVDGSMKTIAGLVAWAAKPEGAPGRIEIAENHVDGRRATIPSADLSEVRRLTLARSGDVLTVAWAQAGRSPGWASLRASRLDLSSFTLIDAEPIVIDEGRIRPNDDELGPPVIGRRDGVLFPGNWLFTEEDTREPAAPAALFLPANGPALLQSLEWETSTHGYLSVGASLDDAVIGIVRLGNDAMTAMTQLEGPLRRSNRLLGGSTRPQIRPWVACAESVCAIAWLDGHMFDSWRAVRVHASQLQLESSAVGVTTIGADRCRIATGHLRRGHHHAGDRDLGCGSGFGARRLSTFRPEFRVASKARRSTLACDGAVRLPALPRPLLSTLSRISASSLTR